MMTLSPLALRYEHSLALCVNAPLRKWCFWAKQWHVHIIRRIPLLLRDLLFRLIIIVTRLLPSNVYIVEPTTNSNECEDRRPELHNNVALQISEKYDLTFNLCML